MCSRRGLDGRPFLTRVRGTRFACGNSRGAIAAVTVEVSDPTLVYDLMESLRASQCIVARIGAKTLLVRVGWPLREADARRELDVCLRFWGGRHRGAWAIRVG